MGTNRPKRKQSVRKLIPVKTVECAPAYRTEVSHARAWITGVVIDVTKVNARSYNLVKTVEPALIPLLVRRNALVTETGPGVLARLRLTRARRAIATHAEVMVVVKKSRTEALHVAAQIIGVALDVTKVNARNCNPAKTAERAPTHRTEVSHARDRKSTRLNSSHVATSYAVFCVKKTKIST